MSETQTSQAANKSPPPPPSVAKSEKPAKPEKTKARTVRVVDLTASEGPRTHEQIINGMKRNFTFEPGKPLDLPLEVAAKFLRHPDAFKLVNEEGEVQPYARPPKQPEELQAGEHLILAEHETIARFDELSSKALMQRALEQHGGERFAQEDKAPDRAAVVAFLIEAAKQKRTANKSAAPDVGEEEFVPEPEVTGDLD